MIVIVNYQKDLFFFFVKVFLYPTTIPSPCQFFISSPGWCSRKGTNNNFTDDTIFHIFKPAMENIIHYPEFVTSTILNWRPLLKPDKYKKLILESLQFLAKENRVILYAYVIMDNHLHLI
jgi:hypothetical protein